MSDGLTALVAFHDPQWIEILQHELTIKGYALSSATTVAEFKVISAERTHDLYIMDVNLGHPSKSVFDAALDLYERIQMGVKAGSILFYPCSASYDVVNDAKHRGLPCLSKADMLDQLRLIPIPTREKT